MAIYFGNYNIKFRLNKKRKIKKWIEEEIVNHKKKVGSISYMFCSDEHIKIVNQAYLKHNYYTDIITFDYCEGRIVDGDILISIDTVKSNSIKYSSNFEEELLRVIIHGILHLLGYNDKSEKEKELMSQKENEAIERYFQNFENGR
jgi:rRNA maturation RNase YbeY